jgi:hypothetical protein
MAYSPAITTYHAVKEVIRDWLKTSEPPLRRTTRLERPEIANVTERISLLEEL